jgi:cytochrome c
MIEGSKGVWGDEPMPPHPNLEPEMATKMIRWILEIGSLTNYSFYSGTEGTFKTIKRNDGENKGLYVLTASYKDRGIEGIPDSRKEGQHTVMLLIN